MTIEQLEEARALAMSTYIGLVWYWHDSPTRCPMDPPNDEPPMEEPRYSEALEYFASEWLEAGRKLNAALEAAQLRGELYDPSQDRGRDQDSEPGDDRVRPHRLMGDTAVCVPGDDEQRDSQQCEKQPQDAHEGFDALVIADHLS